MPVLIVEDDPLSADILALIVQRCGLQDVQIQPSVEAALPAIDGGTFDLILADWMLPGLSGIDLVRRIRKTTTNRTTPVLMVSARNELSDVLEAVEAGANGFVLKPVDPGYMLKQIRKVVPGLEPAA